MLPKEKSDSKTTVQKNDFKDSDQTGQNLISFDDSTGSKPTDLPSSKMNSNDMTLGS